MFAGLRLFQRRKLGGVNAVAAVTGLLGRDGSTGRLRGGVFGGLRDGDNFRGTSFTVSLLCGSSFISLITPMCVRRKLR